MPIPLSAYADHCIHAPPYVQSVVQDLPDGLARRTLESRRLQDLTLLRPFAFSPRYMPATGQSKSDLRAPAVTPAALREPSVAVKGSSYGSDRSPGGSRAGRQNVYIASPTCPEDEALPHSPCKRSHRGKCLPLAHPASALRPQSIRAPRDLKAQLLGTICTCDLGTNASQSKGLRSSSAIQLVRPGSQVLVHRPTHTHRRFWMVKKAYMQLRDRNGSMSPGLQPLSSGRLMPHREARTSASCAPRVNNAIICRRHRI